MTVSSSASWSRCSPPSNVVSGHMSTMWFMVSRWPQSHIIQGRWKPGCRIVGSVTMVWLSFLCFQCFDTVGWAAGRASACKKTEWWGAGVVICLEQGADLHVAQLMPLPLTLSCFSKIQVGFTFLVPAHLGSPRQSAVKRVCACVCLATCMLAQTTLYTV